MLKVKVGDLCLLDGERLVLVLDIEIDGISDDVVLVLLNDARYWVSSYRLLPIYPPT